MNCRYCNANIPEGSPFCPNCGAKQEPVPAAVYPTGQFETPVHRPYQPLLGMILSIIGAILSIVIFIVFVETKTFGALAILMCILTAAFTVTGLVFSIVGMRRSIRTGGRKYVAGIVFSAVGIGAAAFGLTYLFCAVVIGGLSATYTTSTRSAASTIPRVR